MKKFSRREFLLEQERIKHKEREEKTQANESVAEIVGEQSLWGTAWRCPLCGVIRIEGHRGFPFNMPWHCTLCYVPMSILCTTFWTDMKGTDQQLHRWAWQIMKFGAADLTPKLVSEEANPYYHTAPLDKLLQLD